MDLHAITDQGTTHVCTVHRGPADETPLQMISAQRLAELLAAETDLAALLASRPDVAPQA